MSKQFLMAALSALLLTTFIGTAQTQTTSSREPSKAVQNLKNAGARANLDANYTKAIERRNSQTIKQILLKNGAPKDISVRFSQEANIWVCVVCIPPCFLCGNMAAAQ